MLVEKKGNIYHGLSNLKKADIEYFLFFILIEFGEALNKGANNIFFLTFSVVAFLFFIYKMVKTQYNCREFFTIGLLGALGVIIYYFTHKVGGVLTIMALLGLKGVDTKKVLRLSFYIRLISFFLLLLMVSFSVIENNVITNVRGGKTIVRYSMGYSHPNQFHLSFIILLLLGIYLYYEKLKVFQIFWLGALNILIYIVSRSRTSLAIGFLAIFLLGWFRSGFFPKLKYMVCMGIIPFGFLCSILPALFYDKIPNLWAIDRALQWRISFSKYYMNQYSVRLFGNNLNGNSIVLDNGYVELLINYGLIFASLYIASYLILIYRYQQRKMERELLLIVCFSLYGITEAFIPNLFTNLSLILFGELIFPKIDERRHLYELQNSRFY